MRNKSSAITLMAGCILLLGCQNSSPSPNPIPQPSTEPEPSPTVLPSPSLIPSPTLAPSPTIVPSPTVVSSPSALPSLIPSPSPSVRPLPPKPGLGLSEVSRQAVAGEKVWVYAVVGSHEQPDLEPRWQLASGGAVSWQDVGGGWLYVDLPSQLPSTQDWRFVASVTDDHNRTSEEVFSLRAVPQDQSQQRLLHGRSDGKGVDLVITADGFTASEQQAFFAEAEGFARYFLSEPSIARHAEFWNIHALATVSNQSGATNGERGGSRDTYFGSYFNCFQIDRLLCTDEARVMNYVARQIPQFDQIIVAVNDRKYGGAGGQVATYSLGQAARDVAIHELGHSFALLADEYEYGEASALNYEPNYANVTLVRDPERVKWNHWLNSPGVGVIEGAYYRMTGVYRPTQSSIMRIVGNPFDPINAEQWAMSVYRTHSPIYSHFPASQQVQLTPDQMQVFWFGTATGYTDLDVFWYLDGQLSEHRQPMLVLPPDTQVRRVAVGVRDASGLIHRSRVNETFVTHTWQLSPAEAL